VTVALCESCWTARTPGNSVGWLHDDAGCWLCPTCGRTEERLVNAIRAAVTDRLRYEVPSVGGT
jgi:hypothetical protein